MRASASPIASGPAPSAKVQSIRVTASPNIRSTSASSPVARNGVSSSVMSVCFELSSSTFLRLPNRVLRLITRVSRKLSMGGFVTWLKFCRKKWLKGRYWAESTAGGVSSPIEASASFPSSAIGARTFSISSTVKPAAICRRRSAAPVNITGSGRFSSILPGATTFSTQSSKGWLAARRSFISRSW